MKNVRVASGVLFVAGLSLAFLGQYYFAYRRQYAWDGVLFWVVGLLLLGLSARIPATGRPTATDPEVQSQPSWRPSWRSLAVASGVLLSVLAGLLARRRTADTGYASLLGLWLVGVACYLLAHSPVPTVWRKRASLPRLYPRPRRRPTRLGPLLGLVALLLLALAVRAVDLEHVPRNLGGDEGTWGMEGLAMLSRGLANPFSTRWFSFPSMSFLAWGASMRIFGESVAGLRMLSALLGAAAVLTTYALARELWGQRVAWFAGVALAFGHYHLHFSRIAVNNIADAFLATLSLWLVLRGLRLKRTVCFAWAGAAIGLGWYGYFGARLVGMVVATYLALRIATDRDTLAQHGRSLLVLGGAALVVAAPLLLHYARHPMSLVERANQVNIFTSGWLAHEQAATGWSAARLIVQQLWRSISAFNYTLDPTFWYRPTIPLLDFASGALFVLGLLWTTVRIRRAGNGLLLIWFWLSILAGWVSTENPPSSQRLLIAAPGLAILVALGLDWTIRVGRRAGGGSRPMWTGAAATLMAVVAFINVYYYFVVYTPSRVYGNPTAETTTVLGRYLAGQNDDAVVYFHGAPFIYWDFGTLRFLARDVAGVNVPPVGEGEPVEPDASDSMRFVFIPQRLAEIEDVRREYPGGVEASVSSDADGRLLYVLYEVPGPSG